MSNRVFVRQHMRRYLYTEEKAVRVRSYLRRKKERPLD